MKNITKSIILIIAVAVITTLEIKADSLKEDSMKAFYERMRRWDALHGGMRQRESDK